MAVTMAWIHARMGDDDERFYVLYDVLAFRSFFFYSFGACCSSQSKYQIGNDTALFLLYILYETDEYRWQV